MVLLLVAFVPFPSLNLRHIDWSSPIALVVCTGRCIHSLLPPFVCAVSFSQEPTCTLICFFNCLSLLRPGLSFNYSLLLLALPIFCLCCDLITFQCSFQFTHPSEYQVDFTLHHTINSTLQFKVSTSVPSQQSTMYLTQNQNGGNLDQSFFRWYWVRLDVLGMEFIPYYFIIQTHCLPVKYHPHHLD